MYKEFESKKDYSQLWQYFIESQKLAEQWAADHGIYEPGQHQLPVFKLTGHELQAEVISEDLFNNE
jgi:hypothetical protein